MLWKKIFNNQEELMTGEGGVAGGNMVGGDVTEMDICTPVENIDLELNIHVHLNDENQVGRAALLLASTTTPESENSLKKELAQYGWRSVATEVGGLAGDLPQKVTRALVGASLNAGVVEKSRNEMHALMHAAVEALEGFITVGMLEASVGAKIAIVRNDRWIAVAVMGDTAYHAVAHHERCGLGVMHI
ncbi:MAG TPA: hut operon positive regulator HutP [Aminobacterium sp.]|jgi:hut operon positive regulator|uniref:HutP family protein n=1 Tax=Aminobacterium TaxID=81466 RepID=UPI0004678687|nr:MULTISPECIES: HutP family protein [Aminobacterium]HCA40627.1 hut operon positive regulator HutP [Aminobacterium sp.]